ncbi:MAG: tryptophan 2,3-dioxygenase [Flavobacteriales bacterium]|jgi:tryptophan 2,3-dioxygenase
MEFKPEITDKIKELQEKYDVMGQDLGAYLDGLLYSNYLSYWDYTHLDTLLSLQNPRTDFPDEEIFIMYHQITELYFKLCLHEMKQIGEKEKLNGAFLLERVGRINRYFQSLTQSFEVMVQGMDKEQFLKFRMTLLPASGFQSAQYRKIEIGATDFHNLVALDERHAFSEESTIEEMYGHMYWMRGATELQTGKKTLTLKQFEKKYNKDLYEFANVSANTNIWNRYKSISKEEQGNPELIEALRTLDTLVNVNWPLAHYKSAVRYLQREPEEIAATGGTNWQKYLPPRFQKRIFYPSLWTEKEIEEWGKYWVKQALKND